MANLQWSLWLLPLPHYSCPVLWWGRSHACLQGKRSMAAHQRWSLQSTAQNTFSVSMGKVVSFLKGKRSCLTLVSASSLPFSDYEISPFKKTVETGEKRLSPDQTVPETHSTLLYTPVNLKASLSWPGKQSNAPQGHLCIALEAVTVLVYRAKGTFSD